MDHGGADKYQRGLMETIRNVATRVAVLHHHDDELLEMEELARQQEEVELNEPGFVVYQCPRCQTIVTVGILTTEIEVPLPPEAPGTQ